MHLEQQITHCLCLLLELCVVAAVHGADKISSPINSVHIAFGNEWGEEKKLSSMERVTSIIYTFNEHLVVELASGSGRHLGETLSILRRW